MPSKPLIDFSHPVAIAVEPLKHAAIDAAVKYAQSIIDKVIADFEANGWDLNKCAPYPHSMMSKRDYVSKRGKHNLYLSLSFYTQSSRRPSEPNIRKRYPEGEAKFLKDAATMAAEQYLSFVCKLIRKIGTCETATLAGQYVWQHSVITVNGVDRWQTKQIINVSKLGKLFFQWPTRKVK